MNSLYTDEDTSICIQCGGEFFHDSIDGYEFCSHKCRDKSKAGTKIEITDLDENKDTEYII